MKSVAVCVSYMLIIMLIFSGVLFMMSFGLNTRSGSWSRVASLRETKKSCEISCVPCNLNNKIGLVYLFVKLQFVFINLQLLLRKVLV